jgi:hypothetical protein
MAKRREHFNLDSFLTFLLEEVVKADMTMQDRQLEAWKHFSKYKPRNSRINSDIDEGWAAVRYLSLNEVKFRFRARQVPRSFWKRLWQGLKYIFGKYDPQAFHNIDYELTESLNPDTIEITVTVKQEENGQMKLSYDPVDARTRNIFLASPFLQTKQLKNT